MKKYKKNIYILFFVLIFVSLLFLNQTIEISAFNDVTDEEDPAYNPGFSEAVRSFFYNIKTGYCRNYSLLRFIGSDIHGFRKMSRKKCKETAAWVIFCPNFSRNSDRDANDCNCLPDYSLNPPSYTYAPIEFAPGVANLASEEFAKETTKADCSLPNIEISSLSEYFKAKRDQRIAWYSSVIGRKYLGINSASGCVENCGILSSSCLSFFIDNNPDSNGMYNYNHPIFGTITVSPQMVEALMKINRDILYENGWPNCNESHLKELIGWPDECVATNSFREANHSTCTQSNPSQHCSGNAIDISCKEAWTLNRNGCGPQTTRALEILQRYWDYKIIRECSEAERGEPNNTEGPNDIIHIDLRKQNTSIPGIDPSLRGDS